MVFPKEDERCDDALLCEMRRSSTYPNTVFYWHGAIRQHFQTVDSTQVQASHRIPFLGSGGRWLIVSAEEQIAGRGFHGRRWESPPLGNIYVTFVIPFPKTASAMVVFISQVSSIAVARTVKKLGVDPKIKWPNDLMLNNRKVGGVLSENKTGGVEYSAMLIGIGLNINMERSVCESIDQPVTSLFAETNLFFAQEEVLTSLYEDLRGCIEQLLKNGFSSFRDELDSMLALKGERIIVDRDAGEPVQGVFVGMDGNGRVQLRRPDGTMIVLQEGRIRKTSLSDGCRTKERRSIKE